MQDFDVPRIDVWRERQHQDRTFKIGGQEFVYRVAVPPETLLPWLTLSEETTEDAALKAIDETVLGFLEAGQEEKWAAARRPDLEPPLTQSDLLALCKWLMGQQVGRPTGTSSASSPGSQTRESGTTSTDDSSSIRAAEAA